MDRKEKLVSILRNDYGINSMAEMNKAIAKLGLVDISIFCSDISMNGGIKNDPKTTARA